VSKPFSYPELRGRIRVLLRRAYEPRPTPASRVGALTVNHRTREVRVGDRLVALAAKEFELLQTLIADPTRVLTKVNFELIRAEGRGARIQGLGRIGDPPFPSKALAA
jgi:DNA-binding response OmpR family regulator